MATLHPFRALRPNAANAPVIAAVPYDVVTTDEARALVEDHPRSFLRVSRAEIELPAGSDPYADAVYQRAAANFAALRKNALTVEDEASLYFYRLKMGSHVQTGLAACFSIDEYSRRSPVGEACILNPDRCGRVSGVCESRTCPVQHV